jgi:hypothetical protein
MDGIICRIIDILNVNIIGIGTLYIDIITNMLYKYNRRPSVFKNPTNFSGNIVFRNGLWYGLLLSIYVSSSDFFSQYDNRHSPNKSHEIIMELTAKKYNKSYVFDFRINT